jgi:hypothetical protein
MSMTATQKKQAYYREQNLQAARRILADPRYEPGSLMRMWARTYLERHAMEVGKKTDE